MDLSGMNNLWLSHVSYQTWIGPLIVFATWLYRYFQHFCWTDSGQIIYYLSADLCFASLRPGSLSLIFTKPLMLSISFFNWFDLNRFLQHWIETRHYYLLISSVSYLHIHFCQGCCLFVYCRYTMTLLLPWLHHYVWQREREAETETEREVRWWFMTTMLHSSTGWLISSGSTSRVQV